MRVAALLYRVDDDYSNAFTAWKKMGSPERPTPEQYAQLEEVGQLQEFKAAREVNDGDVSFTLPRQAVSLLVLSW